MDYSLDLSWKLFHLLLIFLGLRISEVIICNSSIRLKKKIRRKLAMRCMRQMSCFVSDIVILLNISGNEDDGPAVGGL